MADQWYIDDGQVFVRPNDFEPWLRALDTALARFGASRGTIEQGNAKSSCRLLCIPSDRDQHNGWDTDYVCSSCRVLDSSQPTKVLGLLVGEQTALRTSMEGVVETSFRQAQPCLRAASDPNRHHARDLLPSSRPA